MADSFNSVSQEAAVKQPLKILYLEDDPRDAELVHDQLQRTCMDFEMRVAPDRSEFEAALAHTRFDLILSDYKLPGYDGLAALALARQQQPGVPFILTSGTLSEEQAVDCMLLGATDLVLKQRLDRLGPSMLRALSGAEEHRKRQQAEADLRESLHEKESLLKEIHHRVKNNLQIISSLLRLQSGKIDNAIAKAVLLDMQNRVHSMALIHEHLYRSENLATVDLAAYLRSLCSQLCRTLVAQTGDVQLQFDLTPVSLEIDQAIPCGLLVNELVTNALKHAFPDGRQGVLRVELHPVENDSWLRLRVADNGVGLPPGFDLQQIGSLGLRLIPDLTRQLGGRLEIGNGPGASFEIHFKTHHH